MNTEFVEAEKWSAVTEHAFQVFSMELVVTALAL
jgi:hypothetical protein